MKTEDTSVIILNGDIEQICTAKINHTTGNVELGRCNEPAPHVGTLSVYADNTILGHADTKMVAGKQIFLMKPGDLFDKQAFEEHQKKLWAELSREVGYD